MCVGEKGVEDEPQGLNTCISFLERVTHFLLRCVGTSFHISYLDGMFSFLISDCFVNNHGLRLMGQRVVGLSILFEGASFIFLLIVGVGFVGQKHCHRYIFSNILIHR